jgi:hypothetical protein
MNLHHFSVTYALISMDGLNRIVFAKNALDRMSTNVVLTAWEMNKFLHAMTDMF